MKNGKREDGDFILILKAMQGIWITTEADPNVSVGPIRVVTPATVLRKSVACPTPHPPTIVSAGSRGFMGRRRWSVF